VPLRPLDRADNNGRIETLTAGFHDFSTAIRGIAKNMKIYTRPNPMLQPYYTHYGTTV